MSTRTVRVFREEGLFDYLAEGPVLLDRLDGQGAKRHFATAMSFTLFIIAAAFAQIFYTEGDQMLTSVLGGLAAALGVFFIAELTNSIFGGKRKTGKKKGPLPVVISNEGVWQLFPEGENVIIPWDDIRLVKHQGNAHTVRGTDKKLQVEISTSLAWHEEATAIIKFLFVLRQEMGGDWDGAIPALQKRLSEKGLTLYFERTRKSYVVISTEGITHHPVKGDAVSLTWDDLDNSIFESRRQVMRFKHIKSRTTMDIPNELESELLFDQLLRWGLHSDPVFGVD